MWWEHGDGTEPLWSSVFWSLKWGGYRRVEHLEHRKCFINCRAVHLTVISQTLHQGPAVPLVILLCRLCPVGDRCRKCSAQLPKLTGSCLLAKHLLLTRKVCETLLSLSPPREVLLQWVLGGAGSAFVTGTLRDSDLQPALRHPAGVTHANYGASEPGFTKSAHRSPRSWGLASGSLSFLICKMGIMRVDCLTEWLWEINAIVHIKCSAQKLTFAKLSLRVNSNHNDD